MQTLYPSIKPYKKHKIKVQTPHILYAEECGNPEGFPVLVLHETAGTCCEARDRRFFDPDVYRIIMLDQRGAGQSTPHAELENNNTQALLSDIEMLRKYLNIDRWILFGGCWGATLSLLYAQAHPENVIALIIFSVFLARKCDIEWFYKNGANRIFPDYWEEFLEPLDENERDNILQAYYQRLTGEDELAKMAAAKSWAMWEAHCITLQPHSEIIDRFEDPFRAMNLGRIACHSLLNGCFLEENQILKNIHLIQNIPCVIIHGRYNMISPMRSAWELHKAYPASELCIIRDAGHEVREPGITDALILATKKMATTHAEPPAC